MDNLQIEILPKISNDKENGKDSSQFDIWRKVLYQMLSLVYSFDVHKNTAYTETQKSKNILELFYLLYQKNLQGLYHRGFLRSYVKETRTEPFLKGRWNLTQQISRNPTDKLHFTCTFQRYTLNHLLNQILKKAGEITAKYVSDKYSANAMLHHLEEVFVPHNVPWNKVVYNNKNSYYQETIRLAQLIINTEVNKLSRNHEVRSFVFDMNFLFEQYIAYLLKRERHESIEIQSSKKFWKSRTLRPDIVFRTEQHDFILDTKWKKIEEKKPVSMDDIRQMFCYNELFGCEKALLVYPSTNTNHTTYMIESSEPFFKKDGTHTHSLGAIKVALLNEEKDALNLNAGKEILDHI